MDKFDFVSRIKIAAYDASVAGVLAYLQAPPGRQPPDAVKALSAWFNQLPPTDREQLTQVVKLSVRSAVFSMLSVLDGAKSIRDGSEAGRLQLTDQTPQGDVEINTEHGEFLHDLFGYAVPPLGFS